MDVVMNTSEDATFILTKGKRHFVKANRWEVVSSPLNGYLRGTQLPTSEAKKMLSYGDFYDDGTCLHIYPEDVLVWVKGRKLYLDQECCTESSKELSGLK